MRILVAFKVTPDFELLRDTDWAGAAERGVETRYVRRVLNCFDESALELALRAADGLAAQRAQAVAATGGAPAGAPPVALSALSIGGRELEPFLKTLTALGYERATRIDPRPAEPASGAPSAHDATAGASDAATGLEGAPAGARAATAGARAAAAGLDFAPAAVAGLIARYVRDVDHSDLVLLGCRSGPGDGGTVPFRVAEELGWPCLSQLTELEALADGRLRATCETGDGLARLTLRGPCVLAVGNAVVSSLRAPTLEERLAHRDEPLDVLPADALGVDSPASRRDRASTLIGLEPIDRTRAGALVDGPTLQAKAKALYDGWLRTRLEHLASSSPLSTPVRAPASIPSPFESQCVRHDDDSSPHNRDEAAAPPSAPAESRAEAARFVAAIDATGDGERTASACALQAGALAAFLRDGMKGQLRGETIVFHSDEEGAERLVELAPTREVRLVRVPPRRPDMPAGALADAVREHGAALVLAAAGASSAELVSRLAFRTGGAALTGALDLEFGGGGLRGHAAIYSGHLRGAFELSARPWCVALDAGWNDERGAATMPAEHVVLSRTDATAEHVVLARTDATAAPAGAGAPGESGDVGFTDLELLGAPSGVDLTGSRFLVVAGYGAGDRERLGRIGQAARRMGADFGVSRPVVMNAWAPADRLIGVSGSRAAPAVCIVVGASGAPALFWGIERAGLIVAVNPDKHAPIAHDADLVVCDDGLGVVEALAELIARGG